MSHGYNLSGLSSRAHSQIISLKVYVITPVFLSLLQYILYLTIGGLQVRGICSLRIECLENNLSVGFWHVGFWHTATHCNRLRTLFKDGTSEAYMRATSWALSCLSGQHSLTSTTDCNRLLDVERKPDSSTLQDPTAHCNTLHRTATHCNTMQHTATHCNTLQHTATDFVPYLRMGHQKRTCGLLLEHSPASLDSTV